MRTEIIVGLEIVRDGYTLQPRPGGVAAVFPDGSIERYATCADAAELLAQDETAPASPDIPEEEGWQGLASLPPMMRKKFLRIYAEMCAKKR